MPSGVLLTQIHTYNIDSPGTHGVQCVEKASNPQQRDEILNVSDVSSLPSFLLSCLSIPSRILLCPISLVLFLLPFALWAPPLSDAQWLEAPRESAQM